MNLAKALELYPANPDGVYGAENYMDACDAAAVLAAEVRRLREVVAGLPQGAQDRIDYMVNVLARVEALPATWRAEDEESACHGCADDLEQALRGTP